MHLSKMTYAQVESCFYEASRVYIMNFLEDISNLPKSEQQEAIKYYHTEQQSRQKQMQWSKEKESNSLIDITKTPLNYEIVPHHVCLNPDDAFKKPYRKNKKQKNIDTEQDDTRLKRGQNIADHHKAVTGRAARMNGPENQLSKAEGCIITLPRNYIPKNIGITEKEYEEINKYLSSYEDGCYDSLISQSKDLQNAIAKFNEKKEFTPKEHQRIKAFFSAAHNSFLKVTNTRPEDVLYSIVHLDETFPHLHIMVLPGCISRDTGKFTYSMSKFDKKNFDMRQFHQNMITSMKADYEIDASGLLNGSTAKKMFLPSDLSKHEREQSVVITNMYEALNTRSAELEKKEHELQSKEQSLKEEAERFALKEERFNQKEKKFYQLIHEEALKLLKTLIKPLLQSLEIFVLIRNLNLRYNGIPLDRYLKNEQQKLIKKQRKMAASEEYEKYQETIDELYDEVEQEIDNI